MIRHTALAALLLATAAPAFAQADMRNLTPMQQEAMDDDLAYAITEGLVTEVGHRMAGTEDEARARAWAEKKLTELGFANVRIETYRMPTWVRGKETAEVLSPAPQDMHIAALGTSGSTGDAWHRGRDRLFPQPVAPHGRARGQPHRQDRVRDARHARDAGRIGLWLCRTGALARPQFRGKGGRFGDRDSIGRHRPSSQTRTPAAPRSTRA